MIVESPDPSLDILKLESEIEAFRAEINAKPDVNWWFNEKYVDCGKDTEPYYIIEFSDQIEDCGDELNDEQLFTTAYPYLKIKSMTRERDATTGGYWCPIDSTQLIARLDRFLSMYKQDYVQPPGSRLFVSGSVKAHPKLRDKCFFFQISSQSRRITGKGPNVCAQDSGKMVKEFTSEEWKKIMLQLNAKPEEYGLPKQKDGTVLLASFNIRNLGKASSRTKKTWEFLAFVCKYFDLISVQEIKEDLSGLNKLKQLLDPEYEMVVSDTTGVYPGDRGAGERLAFLFRSSVIQRAEVVTDISLDRTKILETIAKNLQTITNDVTPYIESLKKIEEWENSGKQGPKPKKARISLSIFLDFIRAPYCVSFRIFGNPEAPPYEFMAVNAHLMFGTKMKDRELEFKALMQWIIERVKRKDLTYFPNFILMGDLNLNFDKPEEDREKAIELMKTFNNRAGEAVHVNFPFIDTHPKEKVVFRTNARLDETFDHIGLFFEDKRFPTFEENMKMGTTPQGPDYGVFNFVSLFSESILGKELEEFEKMPKEDKKAFYARFEHEVSDHLPIWLRLPLP